MVKTHKDLEVYKLSIELVTEIYQVTDKFPKEELFGLTAHVRKSAVSIPSNIAEGSAINHKKEFIQFLYIALGSAAELDTQLLISLNLRFLNQEDYQRLIYKLTSVSKMLMGLIKSLNPTITKY